MKKNIRFFLLTVFVVRTHCNIDVWYLFYWMWESTYVIYVAFCIVNNCRIYLHIVWWYYYTTKTALSKKEEKEELRWNKFKTVNNVQWSKTMNWNETDHFRFIYLLHYSILKIVYSLKHARTRTYTKYTQNFQHSIRKTLFTPALSSFTHSGN